MAPDSRTPSRLSSANSQRDTLLAWEAALFALHRGGNCLGPALNVEKGFRPRVCGCWSRAVVHRPAGDAIATCMYARALGDSFARIASPFTADGPSIYYCSKRELPDGFVFCREERRRR